MKTVLTMFGFDYSDARLLFNLLKMNVRDKYLGSRLGSVWAVANPLLLLLIFTFVFTYVFRLRFPGMETKFSYTIWLVAGYGPWLATTEAIMSATMSVVSAAGLVKNMAFKTEILPIAAALTGLLPLGVCSSFLIVLLFADGNVLSWHALIVVLIAILQFAFIISLGFFLSVITVFIRDFGIALPNILMVVLFMTPIFYPLESLPRIMQIVSYANPFYIISEGYRQTLVHHQMPNMLGLLYLATISSGLGMFGLRIFRRLRGYLEASL